MLQDANLDKFRVQFEKLHNALQDATQSNGRLQVKNREVNAELVANAAKVSPNDPYNSMLMTNIFVVGGALSELSSFLTSPPYVTNTV